MKQLRLSPQLALPVDVAGEAIAILAKRGAGKTNTGTVLVEEMHAAGVQVVVLDPVGAWWGLRSSADGGKGLPIPILGGEHGDVPLEPTAGAVIADVVVDSGQSLLLDLSDLPSKAAHAQFVTAFAERLFRRKARDRSLVHLVLEEADTFAPQKTQGRRGEGAVTNMAGSIEQIVRRGRSRGLGLTMITQRSAVLNKDVLTQADVLIVMRTTGPQDIKAVREWVESRGDEHAREVLESLPSLENGEAWVWNPERDILQRTKVRLRKTFDSSSTPKAGQRRAEPKAAAAINLEQLGEQIQATADRAKASDPKELKKRIRELEAREREIDQLEAKASNLEGKVALLERATSREPERVEVPVLTEEERELVAGVGRTIKESLARAEQASDALVELLADIAQRVDKDPPRDREHPPRHRAAPVTPRAAPPAAAAQPAPRPATTAVADGVSAPQQRILNALAALEQIGVGAPDKTQLALFAEASPKSSSYSNNLGHLNNQLGLIRYPQPGRVQLTDDGRQIADAGAAPQTVDELHRYVAGLVGGAKWKLLEQLIIAYDAPLTKHELAERAGASVTSSSFSNNLGSLRSLGLIDYPAPGEIAALPVLFMEGA